MGEQRGSIIMLKGCHHLVVVEGKEGRRGREREGEGGREGGREDRRL